MNKFIAWFTGDTTGARLVRTIIESGLAWVITNAAIIVSGVNVDAETASAIVALITMVLSPVLAQVKKYDAGTNETE